MENKLYHQAQPEAFQSAGYQEYANIDFVINVGEGRSLEKNSVRITGDILIESAEDTQVVAGVDVFLGHKIGIHNVVDSCQVTFAGGPAPGLKENIANYSRFAEMIANGQLYPDDLLNCSNMAELRAVNQAASQLNAIGLVTGSDLNTTVLPIDFSFKPQQI